MCAVPEGTVTLHKRVSHTPKRLQMSTDAVFSGLCSDMFLQQVWKLWFSLLGLSNLLLSCPIMIPINLLISGIILLGELSQSVVTSIQTCLKSVAGIKFSTRKYLSKYWVDNMKETCCRCNVFIWSHSKELIVKWLLYAALRLWNCWCNKKWKVTSGAWLSTVESIGHIDWLQKELTEWQGIDESLNNAHQKSLKNIV